ncbi:MAG: helix-turn-helix domain-containing protein [Chloroflexaceae bacterium]
MADLFSNSALQPQRSFVLDPIGYTVISPTGQVVALAPREYRLLHHLIDHANQILTPEYILHVVWGYQDGADSNLVPVYIRRLRRKLEPDPRNPRHIITVRRQGYKFVP